MPDSHATQKKMLIATHSGSFHADDVFGVAVLRILFPGSELIRTRDPQRFAVADFLVDVGSEWEPQRGRFDHHQKGFAGARPSGVMYASAGLVWKEFGTRCVLLLAQAHAGHALTEREAQDIAHAIDVDLIQYLDMADTGAARSAPGGYGLSSVMSGFNPNWRDEQHMASIAAVEEMRMRQFRRAMEFMADVLINQVRYRVGSLLSIEQVRRAQQIDDGRLLFLNNSALPWTSIVRKEMPRVLFVIGYNLTEQRHLLQVVPAAADSFEAREDLPAAWAGLQGAELAAVTGVPDAVFCHNGRFIAAAISFEGALQLARLALREVDAVIGT